MKKRLLNSYYSRLIFTSALAIILVIFTVVGVIIIQLNRERIESTLNACDHALNALAVNYEDIWNSYYKAFVPIYGDSGFRADLRKFCNTNRDEFDYAHAFQNFERIMKAICQQDRRICGVYFRRYLDDSRYLYIVEKHPLQRVDLDLATNNNSEERSILGGRTFRLSSKNETPVSFYGIQSAILERGGNVNDNDKYQITVLYDTAYFQDTLAEYSIPDDARFYIITREGVVIFDSRGEYSSQDTLFSNIEQISGNQNVFVENGRTYQKNTKILHRSGAMAFYTVPQSSVNGFTLSGTASFVLIFACSISACILLVMFSINRAVSKKFNELEKGLNRVSKNDLHYRLAVGKRNDEFTRIAVQFNKMCDDLEDMINKNYVFQLLQQKMEYKMLQLRVNPHFLFNSLESIREKLNESNENEGSEMVLLLSRIFEYQTRGESIVTVQEELDALQIYINFSEIRFNHMFEYSIDFDKEILTQMIPKQSLQPILENYFTHGIRGDETDYVKIFG